MPAAPPGVSKVKAIFAVAQRIVRDDRRRGPRVLGRYRCGRPPSPRRRSTIERRMSSPPMVSSTSSRSPSTVRFTPMAASRSGAATAFRDDRNTGARDRIVGRRGLRAARGWQRRVRRAEHAVRGERTQPPPAPKAVPKKAPAKAPAKKPTKQAAKKPAAKAKAKAAPKGKAATAAKGKTPTAAAKAKTASRPEGAGCPPCFHSRS